MGQRHCRMEAFPYMEGGSDVPNCAHPSCQPPIENIFSQFLNCFWCSFLVVAADTKEED